MSVGGEGGAVSIDPLFQSFCNFCLFLPSAPHIKAPLQLELMYLFVERSLLKSDQCNFMQLGCFFRLSKGQIRHLTSTSNCQVFLQWHFLQRLDLFALSGS